jgi:hypothetical protein
MSYKILVIKRLYYIIFRRRRQRSGDFRRGAAHSVHLRKVSAVGIIETVFSELPSAPKQSRFQMEQKQHKPTTKPV